MGEAIADLVGFTGQNPRKGRPACIRPCSASTAYVNDMTSASGSRPGNVRDALIAFLKKHPNGGTLNEIYAALGTSVPKSSIRSSLRLRRGDLFTQIGRSTYKLRAER